MKFRIIMREIVFYEMEIEAENEAEAVEQAESDFCRSPDPYNDFCGSADDRTVLECARIPE
jgi:hypothetical protein